MKINSRKIFIVTILTICVVSINLAVFFGGESCEHDISIITGVQLMHNCNEYLYNVIPVYIDKNGSWLTGKSLFDLDNYPNHLSNVKECTLIPNSNYIYIKNFLCQVCIAILQS